MIVAQLSDIHADGSSEAFERLDLVLGWLRPLKPDAIVVSGDIAEHDHRNCYRAVRWRLETFGAPFFIVPGNVDDHEWMLECFGDLYGWVDQRPLHVVGQVNNELSLLGLDVTVAGAHHGDAGPALGWLAQQLSVSTLPTLIFQHQHPFACGIDGKDINFCRGGDELARVIEAAGDVVLGLTCGHVHRPMLTRFAKRQAIMAPSVARANRLRLDGKEPTISDPPGLLLHHVKAGQLTGHVVMVPA